MAMSRVQLDVNREKQVIINLILSTPYCSRVVPFIKDEYFKAQHVQIILSWVKAYFTAYKVAPGSHIQDMFEAASAGMEPPIRDQVRAVLEHLSEIADTQLSNIDYMVDNAMELLEEKHLKLQLEAAEFHLSKGDLKAAEVAMSMKFTGHAVTTDAVRLDDIDFITESIQDLTRLSDADNAFFRYEGRLGDFIGNIERGWLVSFIAPPKRGKTIYMTESAITAMRRRLNTVLFTLEMPKKQIFGRIMKAVTGYSPMGENDDDSEYDVMTPIMDCALNQDGSCDTRSGIGSLTMGEGGALISYVEFPNWIVCNKCRGTHKFRPAAWKVPVVKAKIEEGKYKKRVNSFMRLYGKHCRLIFHPSKSAGVADLRNDLALLESRENFIPDVIIIDYADLLRPAKGGDKRTELDDIWEDLRSLGQEKQVLLITASQTNRASVDSKFLRSTDIAEDFSKIAKLDLGIGLCQGEQMKLQGIMNMNKLAYRHGEFAESHTCTLLQEIGHMQGLLDSEFSVM